MNERIRVHNEPIGVLIADDEPLARELLRSMLSKQSGISIIGECRNGAETVAMVRRDRPDLLFLDIQMPELDGFEILSGLPPEVTPAVIFVTAFDQYAIQAFEVNALDYLLKPFDEERLARALVRARSFLERRNGTELLAETMLGVLRRMQAGQQYMERLVIREGNRSFLQPTGEIDWLEADGKYTRVHVGAETHAIREGISKLEQDLDPSFFLRISRSAIVNIDRIREVRSWFQGDYLVVLKNGKQLSSTRSYREGLQALLGRRS